MKREITLVALSFFVFTVSGIAQQTADVHKERTVSNQSNSKPVQHVQEKSFNKIWGAEASYGTADGQFQNPFMSSVGTLYSTTNWTAVTVNEASGTVTPGNAYWYQTMTGISIGAYFGSAPVLQSPTQANGAAIFDSDYFDNAGIAGSFGNGPSPAAHEGWLVSPRIDMSGYTDSVIAVRFWCKWREFVVNDLTVSMSNDDGITWEEASIKGDLPSGGNDVEGWVTKYFTNIAYGVSNLTQCRLRFRFNGNYYYAMIDDVTIETGPGTDLTVAPNDISSGFLSDQMYQLQVMNNRHMPISGITDPRDFSYGVVVQNEGGGAPWHTGPAQDGLMAYVQRDNGGVWTTVYSDTMDLPEIPYDASEIITDTISDMSWATVGDYRMLYILNHWDDQNSNNDTLMELFSINDDIYASKVQRGQDGLPVIETRVFPAGTQSTFEFGSTFEFSGMGTSNKRVDSVSQGFYVPTSYVGPTDVNYTIRFYEWNDANGNLMIDDATELILVALGADTVFGAGNAPGQYIMQSTPLIDVNTFANGYAMQDNKIYVSTVSLVAAGNGQTAFGSTEMLWVACASSVNYAMNFMYTNEKPSFLHLIDGGGTESFIDQGFGFDRIPAMGLHISENCEPIAADLDFTENFLEVSFTDMSTSQGDPANSWSWDFGDGNTSTMQNPTHTYAAPGQYEVCLTVSNGCNTETFCDSVEVEQNTSSLTENWEDALLIYPNPADDVVRIQNLPADAMGIELRNVVGQIVYEAPLENEAGVKVPVSQLASGHYNMIITSSTSVAVKHVVVK